MAAEESSGQEGMKEVRAGGRESKPLVTRRRVQFGGGGMCMYIRENFTSRGSSLLV